MKSFFLYFKRNFRIDVFLISIILIGCNSNQGNKSLSNEYKGMRVPEGYTIDKAVDSNLISYPMFASFDDDGRLFLCESDGTTTSTEDMLERPHFHIRLLEDTDGDGIFDKSTIFADSLSYPMGAAFYQGSLFVTSAPDLLKLTDADGDGIADKREVLLTGWTLNHNAATLGGPYIGPDGWFYLTDARRGYDIVSKEGVEFKGKGANIWRCKPDGTELERVSGGGFDNSIELVFMDGGETIGTMTYFTDPKNGYRDAIMHWVYGGVYPKPFPTIQEDKLKLTGDLMPVMTRLPRIAHAGIMRYLGNEFGEDFEGDLLTAQFNTGKIMRYKIEEDGATFRTTESTFMSSENKDSHPTDVLQSADGSILVVNTGGWFIAGCPLSRVAKTDILGGIYRIQKDGQHKIKDPWGKKIDFSKSDNKELITFLNDPRFSVRNKATEELVERRNPEDINELKKLLVSSDNSKLRNQAVFILYRIGTPESMKLVRNLINDGNDIVRTSTARVLGLARDQKSLEILQKRIINEKSSRVRRQIATALGEIGDITASKALLKVSKNISDRFEEHSIIYSLITLKDAESLKEELLDSAPETRRVALIALDQMDGSPIDQDEVYSFLKSKDSTLIKTGLWVTSHHLEWSGMVASFIKDILDNEDMPVSGLNNDIMNLIVTFSSEYPVQKVVGAKLMEASLQKKLKTELLDIINKTETSSFPSVWIAPLKLLLKNDSTDIKLSILNMIGSKDIASMEREVQTIIKNQGEDLTFRLQAIDASLTSQPEISDFVFSLLLKCLEKDVDFPIKQLASRIISKSRLDRSKLKTLAGEVVPNVDKSLVPEVLQVFENSPERSSDIGLVLSKALQEAPDRTELLNMSILKSLFNKYPDNVLENAKPLFTEMEKREASRLEELGKVQKDLRRGDVAKGRALFFGKAICYTCHSVEGKGGTLGPDLTNIGSIRSEHDILEAILFPSASFAREYETSKVVTKNNSFTGIIRNQLSNMVIMQTGPNSRIQIPKSDVVSIGPVEISLMPTGLKDNLTNEEFSDLIAYLESLPNGLGHKD